MTDLPPTTRLGPAARRRRRDIAARAGISATLASHVLNGKPTGFSVSEETAQRVRPAADPQYHPNAAARALGSRQTESIALIDSVVEDDERYFPRLSHLTLVVVVSGISGVTRHHNYRLLIQMADRHFLETRAHLGLAHAATVDGFIWWGAPVPSQLLAIRDSVVALNASTDAEPHRRVFVDHRGGARCWSGVSSILGTAPSPSSPGRPGSSIARNGVLAILRRWRHLVLSR
jgi:DNA-binding LacI/PurR family transcriptional regulator